MIISLCINQIFKKLKVTWFLLAMEDKGVQEIKNAPNKGPEYVLKYIHFPQCVSIRANLCLLVLYILFTLHIPFSPYHTQ